MSVQYVSFVAVRVTDLAQSLRFYRDAIGFRPVSRMHVDGRDTPSARELGVDAVPTEMIFLERDGMRLQIGSFHLPEPLHLPSPRRQLGFSHFGVRVTDVDATVADVIACGGSLVEGSRVSNPSYGSEVASVRDPDGARLELLQLPGAPDAPMGEPFV